MIFFQKINVLLITFFIFVTLNFLDVHCEPFLTRWWYSCNYPISIDWKEFEYDLETNPFCVLYKNPDEITRFLNHPSGRSSKVFKNSLDIVFSELADPSQSSVDEVVQDSFLTSLIHYLFPPGNLLLLISNWFFRKFLLTPIYSLESEARVIYDDILNHISDKLEKVDFFRTHNPDDQIGIIQDIQFLTRSQKLCHPHWTICQSMIGLDISFLWSSTILKIPIITIYQLTNDPNLSLFKELNLIDNNFRDILFEEIESETLRFEILHLLQSSSIDISYQIPYANTNYTRFLNRWADFTSSGPDSLYSLKVGEFEVCNVSYCNIFASRSANDTLQFTIYPPHGVYPHVTVDSHGLFEAGEEETHYGSIEALLNEIKDRKLMTFDQFFAGTSHPPLIYSEFINGKNQIMYFHSSDNRSLTTCSKLRKNSGKHDSPSKLEVEGLESKGISMSKFLYNAVLNDTSSDQLRGAYVLELKEKLNRSFNDTETPWIVGVEYTYHSDSEIPSIFIYANGSMLYRGNGHDIIFPSTMESTFIVDHFLQHPARYNGFIDFLEQVKLKRWKYNLDFIFGIPDLLDDLRKCMPQEHCRSMLFSKIPDVTLSFQPPDGTVCRCKNDKVEILWNNSTFFSECVGEPNEFYKNLTGHLFDVGKGYTVIPSLFSERHLGYSNEEMIFGLIRQDDVAAMDHRRTELLSRDIRSNIFRFGSIATSVNLYDYQSTNGRILFRMDNLTIDCLLSDLILTLETSIQFNDPDSLLPRDFKAVLPIFFNMHLERTDLYERVNNALLTKLIWAHPFENEWITLFDVLSNKSVILGSSLLPSRFPPNRASVKSRFRLTEISPNKVKVDAVILPLNYESFEVESDAKKAELIIFSLFEKDVKFWEKMTLNDLLVLFSSDVESRYFKPDVMNGLLTAASYLMVNVSTLVDDPSQEITVYNLNTFLDGSSLSANIPSEKKNFVLNLVKRLLGS